MALALLICWIRSGTRIGVKPSRASRAGAFFSLIDTYGDIGMKGIVLFGAMLALIGLIAFARPSFNTVETRNVVRLGDLKVQARTEEPHVIPPIVSGGAIVLGVLLMGAGMVIDRQ
jgi:hypothetical protein